MASLAMHLAIAQEYYKTHTDLNCNEFLRGTLQPDLAEYKHRSHFSSKPKDESMEESAKSKVDIIKYVGKYDLSSDYYIGKFLHLLTDYLFYSEYLINIAEFKALKLANLEQAKEVVFSDYDRLTVFLQTKYNLDLSILPECARVSSKRKPKVLQEQSVAKFIKYCVGLDLEAEYLKIKAGELVFSC